MLNAKVCIQRSLSYNAARTQCHLRLSRLEHLEHCRTPFDDAHFKHAQSTHSCSAYWQTRRNEVESPWQLIIVANRALLAPLRSSYAQNRNEKSIALGQRPLGVLCPLWCHCVSFALSLHPHLLNVLFNLLFNIPTGKKELFLRSSRYHNVSSAFFRVRSAGALKWSVYTSFCLSVRDLLS